MTSLPDLNYYDILSCQITDTIEEIKKSYQTLVLKYHPDKQSTPDAEDLDRFHQIDVAWKTLRDPIERKKYDAELKQKKFNENPIVHAKVRRTDFEYDTENELFTFPCRCGGYFVLPDEYVGRGDDAPEKPFTEIEENVDEDEVFIECDECSFVIQFHRN